MKYCKNDKCSTSTGICERITHGHGILSLHGYWQYPCFICARHYEDKLNSDWPHVGEVKELASKKCKECGEVGLVGESCVGCLEISFDHYWG